MNDAEDDDNVIYLDPASDSEQSKSRVANPLNIRKDLNKNALTKGLVAFDEFAHRTMLMRPIPRPKLKAPKTFEPRPWEDVDDTALVEHLNGRGFRKVGRGMVRDVIELEARSRPFHPVRDYLAGLKWDGKPRLSRFLIDYCGAVLEGDTDEEKANTQLYIEHATRCWFVSAVARAMRPGCKADHVLILEGVGGTLKSSMLRALAVRDGWFSDSLPHNLASRDGRQHLIGVWIIELAEIAQFKRSEVETIKDFISCQVDRFRPPYGRSDITAPRQSVFIATTNDHAYLRDTTGNRRFWPVHITEIKLTPIRAIVDQLWAEAFAAFKAGEKWWLSARLEKLAARQQDERLEQDPWLPDIMTFVESHRHGVWFSTADVLQALNVSLERRERGHEMRIGAVLRQLGCERKKRWNAKLGKPRWTYMVPERKEGEDDEEDLETPDFKGMRF